MTITRDVQIAPDYLGTDTGTELVAAFEQELRDEFGATLGRVEMTTDHVRNCCVAEITLTPSADGPLPVEPIGAAEGGVDDGGDES